MNVEREIAGFAMPFTAGILVTAYAGCSFCMNSLLIHHLASLTIIAATCGLMTCSPGRTDYSKWLLVFLAATGCGMLTAATGISLNTKLPVGTLEAFALDFGKKMQTAIDSIPFDFEETGALVKALLTGERDSLPKELIKAFRDSGASHILALSGLHLGIIYMIFSRLLAVMGNSITARICRSCMIVLSCGLYTLATGAGASIVRAFLFIFLAETAKLSGRSRNLRHIFFASLILQLTITPLSVRSVSFQLSYAAMAGIAYIFPWLKGLWAKPDDAQTAAGRIMVRAMRWIWNSTTLSISCQITTGPLAYIYFGTFPAHFMLTNLLALPLTGILIPFAVLTLSLSFIGICPEFIIQTTEGICLTLIRTLEIIATM